MDPAIQPQEQSGARVVGVRGRAPGAGRGTPGVSRRAGEGAGRRGSARGGGRQGPGAGVGGHGTGGGNPRQPDDVGGRRQRPDSLTPVCPPIYTWDYL